MLRLHMMLIQARDERHHNNTAQFTLSSIFWKVSCYSVKDQVGDPKMKSEMGYEFIPCGAIADASPTKRGVYHSMLEDFAGFPFSKVEVRYENRGTQAIYMGLRNARKAASPSFDFIRISREGASETEGKVFLEK